MPQSSHAVLVPHGPDEVWAFLIDPTRLCTWRRNVVEASLESGEAGRVGAVIRVRELEGGRVRAADLRITAADEPAALAFEVVAGPTRYRGGFLLRATGADTLVRLTLDTKHHGLIRAAAPGVQRRLEEQVAALDGLASALARRVH